MDFKYQLTEDTGFKGIIVVTIPSRMARLKMLQEIRFTVSENGELKISENHIEYAMKQQEMVEKQVKFVDVEILKTGDKANKLSDLDAYSEYTQIVNDIANIILNGVSLGKL